MKGKGGSRLDVRLLGRFELRLDDRPVGLPSRPAQSLLAYLVLSAGTPHRREKLASLLWPDADDENGRSYLRHALWRIRKVLATGAPNGGFIQSDDLVIGFDPAASYTLDVSQFETLGTGTTDELVASLGRYRGELLPGFYDDWAIRERERLEAVLPARMQRLMDALAAEARWPELIEWAERWISLEDAPEGAYRALMVAHASQGDRARTVAAYQRCVEALRRELDAEPSEQTRETYERLMRTAPPRVAATAPPPARHESETDRPDDLEPPFKGLQHFDEADASLFFGREELTTRLAARLEETSFLAVIGASGSGKSSLLRAGLVPALRRRGSLGLRSRRTADTAEQVYVMTPTAHPLEALAVVLTASSGSAATTAALLDDLGRDPRSLRLHALATRGRVILVVDQFEELFTLCADPFEREAFVDNLLTASLPDRESPATVVLALRADFYAHCAEYPALRDALARFQEYIGPMGPEELRRAIEAPAARTGSTFEPGLVDLLLREVGDEPGALPLLSHALLETWHRREGRALTHRGYGASGGLRGAIARTAEAFIERADDPQRAIARRIFLRLTELGDGTQDTRRRVTIDELTSGARDAAAVLGVLRTLADARLITIGERTAEVAHEALIREWPRLREWLDQDRELIRAQRHLTRAAIEWDRLGRDVDGLYRGNRLQQALAWVTQSPDELTELERSFLEASRATVEGEALERQSATTRLRRRALYLAAALLVLALTAGLAAFFAEQARVNAAATELEQHRTLLDSARAAGENIDSRLATLHGAIAAQSLLVTLGRIASEETGDDDARALGPALALIRQSAGPDAALLFMTEYLRDELVAVDDTSVQFGGAGPSARISAAREALAGTVPPPLSCSGRDFSSARSSHPSTLAYGVSQPYLPVPGGHVSVAMVHYGPPCQRPYALILEASLQRGGEWMGLAIAESDDAYLIDGAGRLLARTRRDPEHLRDLAGSELVGHALRSTDPFVIQAHDPLDTRETLSAVAPLGDRGWRVIVLRPATRASSRDDPTRLIVLSAVTIGLLVGAVTAWVRYRRVPRAGFPRV